MACVYVQAVSAIAKKHGILHACDSTFSTPIMVKPIEHGCDLVIQVRTCFHTHFESNQNYVDTKCLCVLQPWFDGCCA
jgi:O-acetylhomoserine/O-acetylserine sulfhydrylase-like pyridoxal-dependent enzyme